MCEIKVGTKVKWTDEDRTLKEGYDKETVYNILDNELMKKGFNVRRDWLKKYFDLTIVKGVGKVKSIEVFSKRLPHIEIITLNNGREFGRRNGVNPSRLIIV